MAVTYGFYNSTNGDRKYTAAQMSSIFDGIINDGVYQSIGTAFAVTPGSGLAVNVGVGRAWFMHTWTYNDAIISLGMPSADVQFTRIDAIVIEVNANDGVRANSIKVITGIPASSPTKPVLTRTSLVGQYAIAYITRKANSTSISGADIEYVVGKTETPFVTGPLKVIDISNFVAQWGVQWNDWFNSNTSSNSKSYSDWIASKQSEYNTWFSGLQTNLSGDVAANLQNQINDLKTLYPVRDDMNSLASTRTISRSINDSNGNVVYDSSGNPIYGSIVFASVAAASSSTTIVPDPYTTGLYVLQ